MPKVQQKKERDPLVAFRIPPAMDERLRALAAAEETTVSELVRSLIQKRLSARTKPAAAPSPPQRSGRARSAAGTCQHRMRAGSWCARCNRLV